MEASRLITRSIERLVGVGGEGSVAEIPGHYPALLALYSSGIAALAAKRFDSLAAALIRPRVKDRYERAKYNLALSDLTVWTVFDRETYKWLDRPTEREYTPANNRMMEFLGPLLTDYIPDPGIYEDTFDLFEYILALVYADTVREGWIPPGRYWWRWRYTSPTPGSSFLEDGAKSGKDWGLLKSGFFGGSLDRLGEVVQIHDDFLKQVNRWG